MAVRFVRALVVAALLTSTGWPATVNAQSLAAIAQREAERRKQTPSGRKYTNEELRPAPAPSTPAAAMTSDRSAPQGDDVAKPAPESPPSESSAATANTAPEPPKPPVNEAEWRERARERRERLQRFRSDLAILEGRLAEVEQRVEVSPEARSERQALEAPLAALRSELAKWTAEWGRFEQRARAANVPPEWIQ